MCVCVFALRQLPLFQLLGFAEKILRKLRELLLLTPVTEHSGEAEMFHKHLRFITWKH